MEVCPYLLRERGEPPTALTHALTEHGYAFYDEQTFRRFSSEEDLLRSIPWGGSANVVASVPRLAPV